MTSEEALAAAEAEGLTLKRSSRGATGFLNVRKSGNQCYRAKVYMKNCQMELPVVSATAEGAALAVARFDAFLVQDRTCVQPQSVTDARSVCLSLTTSGGSVRALVLPAQSREGREAKRRRREDGETRGQWQPLVDISKPALFGQSSHNYTFGPLLGLYPLPPLLDRSKHAAVMANQRPLLPSSFPAAEPRVQPSGSQDPSNVKDGVDEGGVRAESRAESRGRHRRARRVGRSSGQQRADRHVAALRPSDARGDGCGAQHQGDSRMARDQRILRTVQAGDWTRGHQAADEGARE